MARNGNSPKVVVVCLWSHEDIFRQLQQSCGNLPLAQYNGQATLKAGIVGIYNQALKEIDADFFFFAHQDVAGNIPAFINTSLQFMDHKDIVGEIGKDMDGTTTWRHDGDPIQVGTLDECAFGFYKDSGYTFDPNLVWTNYSQDICLLAQSKGGKVWVPPHNLGHAKHKWGPWFIKEGYFHKELAYLKQKWGPFPRS